MSYIIRLIKKAQKGNEKAFLKLFQMYEADIYRMAFIYLKNEEEALDIVQETAYKAFDKIESLKEPTYIKTWFIKIAISSSLNRLKKLEKIVPVQNEYIDNIQFEQVDPTVKVLLRQILEKLTNDEKGIVLLKYYEGYTFQEIADTLQIPLGTVKSILYRALKKLRVQVEEADFYG
ncbi:RNA polymerase sigma factor [Lysinibacillus sp. NPDC059133]|uniref:RNA polymerase sigma factor n=1 Tax=Lysinibacillus sp. NPDC059133 TaxID=3346737 RepID=UPI0036839D6D